MNSLPVIQIINSGQTGVDIGSLIGARRLNIETGGTARNNYMTHDGPKRKELMALGLCACESDESQCITNNINHSQACLFLTSKKNSVYHDFIAPIIREHNLPFLVLNINDSDSIEKAIAFLQKEQPYNLFVTGDSNRLSPKIAHKAASFIEKLFS